MPTEEDCGTCDWH